jgi:hypothetical protein
MVDVTFPFMVFLGGALAGLVTAIVRGHRGRRLILDILIGELCGISTAALWFRVAPAFGPDVAPLSPGAAALLSDLLWLSPVIGGLVGVLALALLYRLMGLSVGRDGPWQKLGAGLLIVGAIYATISIVLTAVLFGLAWHLESMQFVQAGPILTDLVKGPVVMLIGWATTRIGRAHSREG